MGAFVRCLCCTTKGGEISKALWLPDIIIGQSCAVLWAFMSVFIFVLGRPEWAASGPRGLVARCLQASHPTQGALCASLWSCNLGFFYRALRRAFIGLVSRLL